MPSEREYHEPPTSTSTSLLEGAKTGDSTAWERMVRLYFPLVYGWCAHRGLRPEDCLDITQEIFVAVSQHVQRFEKTAARGSFRSWLRTITENKLTDYWRRKERSSEPVGGSQAHEVLLKLPCAAHEGGSDTIEQNEKSAVFRAAVEIILNEFEPRTWDAFWRVTAESRPVDVVAVELGMSNNAVYLAKSRVLRRLREILRDSFDDL